MPERSHSASDLDARLAEIDGALQAIQAELIPESAERRESPRRRPRPPPARPEAPPGPAEPPRQGRHGPLESLLERTSPRGRSEDAAGGSPGGPREPLVRLAQLTEAHMRLLASSNELLDAYLEVLETLRSGAGEAPHTRLVTADVGPFANLVAVRAFEAALATLPGVLDVSVRGYERGDRAIIEVQLVEPRASRGSGPAGDVGS